MKKSNIKEIGPYAWGFLAYFIIVYFLLLFLSLISLVFLRATFPNLPIIPEEYRLLSTEIWMGICCVVAFFTVDNMITEIIEGK